MARLLVTGASGLLGSNVCLRASAEHKVVAVSRQSRIAYPGVESLAVDLADPAAARRLVSQQRPDWLVHCAAATNVDACETDPVTAMRVNRDVAGWMAEAAREGGARMIHISTDAVFDGRNGPYAESDPPAPVNAYGRSKLAGEESVAAAFPSAAILRTNFFGWGPRPGQGLAEWFLGRLEREGRCPGFRDVWFNPLLVNALAEILIKVLEAGLAGIYHVTSPECLSKLDFGRRLASAFGEDPDRIAPVSVDEAGLKAPRPKRMCLASNRVQNELRIQLPTVAEGVASFRALAETGYPARIRSWIGESYAA